MMNEDGETKMPRERESSLSINRPAEQVAHLQISFADSLLRGKVRAVCQKHNAQQLV